MRISVRFQGDVAVMSLSGRFLAGGDGPFLRQKVRDLIDGGAKNLIIDFSGVPYIDSTGLGFLAGSRVTAQNAGVNLILANLNRHVKRILENVRLTQFFTIADDEASALAQVKDAGQPPAASNPAPPRSLKKKH